MSAYVGKELSTLGVRSIYNRTLRHMIGVTNYVDAVEKNQNLADVLNEALDNQTISREQIPPILSVILVSRLNVPVLSFNLDTTYKTFNGIVQNFSKWNAIDMIVAYHHPNLGVQLINPANESHWEYAHELKRDELVVLYARHKKGANRVAEKAIDAFIQILKGKMPEEDSEFILPSSAPVQAPAPTPQPAAAQPAPTPEPAQAAPAAAAPQPPKPKGKMNVSPRYSVQVTNELFHNGNVEAWKNIIEAFQERTKLRVIVYHEGELIQDLNSLFKWGKVKHGGVISFQVAGENLKFVSRLQKYLYEGASSRFEAFLKKDINRILNIF